MGMYSHGNLCPKVLCCDELIKLLVLYLPEANTYCADFGDYRNVIYSAPRAGLCIPSFRQTSTFPFPVHWEWESEGMGMLKAIPAHL